jgi:hypothetical protein
MATQRSTCKHAAVFIPLPELKLIQTGMHSCNYRRSTIFQVVGDIEEGFTAIAGWLELHGFKYRPCWPGGVFHGSASLDGCNITFWSNGQIHASYCKIWKNVIGARWIDLDELLSTLEACHG